MKVHLNKLVFVVKTRRVLKYVNLHPFAEPFLAAKRKKGKLNITKWLY